MKVHKSLLAYTNEDDGIWLTCHTCRLDIHLGQEPTIPDTLDAWREHAGPHLVVCIETDCTSRRCKHNRQEHADG